MSASSEVPEPEHEAAAAEPSDPRPRAARWRMAILAILFFGSLVLAKVTGLDERVDVETVRAFMADAGAWGFLLFVAAFTVGELVHVPGLVFVAAAAVVYGETVGMAAAYTGALVSVATNFVVIRAIGGQPLGEIKRPFVRKVLARLEDRPVTTVAVLRLIFILLPAVNYVMAMSPVKFRHFVLGSAMGLVVPIVAAVLAADWLVAVFL